MTVLRRGPSSADSRKHRATAGMRAPTRRCERMPRPWRCMRIAVDVRELCGRPTGVGRYLTGLLDAWSDNATAQRHQWTLYAHAPPSLPSPWHEHLRVIGGGGGTAWEQTSLARALGGAERPDVLFAPG